MSKIYTAQVQLGALPSAGVYGDEYSYDGNASYVGGGYDDNTNKPLEDPTGRNCDDYPPVTCLALVSPSPTYPTASATYDFGGLWREIDRLQIQNYHDGDWWVSLSEDNITWYSTNTHRITWAAASCQTDTYGAASFPNPGGWSGHARYIKFNTKGVILVGDRSATVWFNVRGIPPGSADILTDDVQLGTLPTGSKIYPVGVYLG